MPELFSKLCMGKGFNTINQKERVALYIIENLFQAMNLHSNKKWMKAFFKAVLINI